MKPDKKYMSEVKSKNTFTFNFVPPSFDRNLVMDDDINAQEDDSSILFPSETSEDQLYCYYNSLGGCSNIKNILTSSRKMPETFDVLRGLDLDIDETCDLDNNDARNIVNEIYSDIIKKNPGINDTLTLYEIPSPIQMVITKRLIKLSLLYNKNE